MKIFCTLDNLESIEMLNVVKGWTDLDGKPFEIVTAEDLIKKIDKEDDEQIKAKLHEKMISCDVVAVLVGPKTKSFRKATKWQIEYAVEAGLTLICLNANGIRAVDYDRCPTFLKRHLSLHITMQNEVFNYALENWPNEFRSRLAKEDNKTYRYSNDTYEELGLHTADFA